MKLLLLTRNLIFISNCLFPAPSQLHLQLFHLKGAVMIQTFGRYLRQVSLLIAAMLCASLLAFAPIQSAYAAGNRVNVILMIGDGMGWEMARAAAVAKGNPLYTRGKGRGLSFQKLTGYSLATTYGTTIAPANGTFSTTNAALDGTNPSTGASPVLPGFTFAPTFNEGTTSSGGALNPNSFAVGNLVGYKPELGGSKPWTPISPAVAAADGYNPEYIKYSLPDSANTATSLYTGVKSYNNAIAVDIFEKDLKTILQTATGLGKSTGVVTSVPFTHATPGAAVSTVNRRNKYDSDFPLLDSILQEAILQDQDGDTFLPTVLLGGGHPLDHENKTATGGACNYVYIKASTYKELAGKTALSDAEACSATIRSNPSNRYAYTFLERDPAGVVDGGDALLAASETIDPNQGQRLLGIYGTRGQNGNLPRLSAAGNYSLTGLDNFSLNGGGQAIESQAIDPDTVRPLLAGETTQSFISKEIKANPTLAELTQAALNVLGKDPDGFWMMVEGGDIDWAAHDNNLDNLIGTMNSFDAAVQTAIDWVNRNGGWRKNVLIVTADHDHYWTLNSNYPTLIASTGANAMTFTASTPATAGYFTGSDPTKKYGWHSHSNRPVPVYYQGRAFNLSRFKGQGHTQYGQAVAGIPGLVDQVHIYQAMLNVLTAPAR
jgi:alkaline phosphatase